MTSSDSRVISKTRCPLCADIGKDTKGNGLATYDDGHTYCFKCETRTSNGDNQMDNSTDNSYDPQPPPNGSIEPRGLPRQALTDRRISANTCNKYGVTVAKGQGGKIEAHFYPYYNSDNQLLGYKERNAVNKNFKIIGTNKGSGLFGQNIFGSGNNKYLTITEGELDALSVYEMLEGKGAVVSLKNGIASAEKDIKENLEYIESFENVVLCFDQDEAGQKGIQKVRDIISPNKLKICSLPTKDANELLMLGKVKDFVEAWWNAEPYTPAGILKGSDTWEHLLKNKDVVSIDYPWNGLNDLTYGFRGQELVTITSGSGMGKTSVVKELESHILNKTDDNLAIIHLEESIERSVLGLMGIEANLPIHIPQYGNQLHQGEKKELWQKSVADKNVYFYDHFGSMSEANLLNIIRVYAKAYDCKWIVLDHLSIVVSSQEGFDDERKAIDAIMTNLRKIVQETGVGLFLVSHLKRPQGKAHEEGGQVSLSELRGSAAIAQLSDIVIGLERNQQHEDSLVRNQTTLRVIKNRFSGLTGPACKLQYTADTGRLKEVNTDVDSFF